MPYFDTGRICLNYEIAGSSRDAIVLVHELGGSSRSWSRLMPLLSHRWQVIAPDLRGYGQSEKPPGRREINDYALDLAALAEGLGLRRIHVVGTAMGAIIAAALASIRPDLVSHLVCLDGAASLTNDARRYIYDRAGNVRANGMRAVVDLSLTNSFPEAFADLRARYRPSFLANDPASYAEASEALCRLDVDYGRIAAPTLVASGALDFIWPAATGRDLSASIAGSRFITLETAGHFPHIQTPEQCAEIIIAFLAGELT